MILSQEEVLQVIGNPADIGGSVRIARAIEQAILKKMNSAETICYAVIEPSGYINFTAVWHGACNEHINDAINEHGLLEAKYWKVIKLFTPPPAPSAVEWQPIVANFIHQFKRHVGGDGEFWLHELEDFYTNMAAARSE